MLFDIFLTHIQNSPYIKGKIKFDEALPNDIPCFSVSELAGKTFKEYTDGSALVIETFTVTLKSPAASEPFDLNGFMDWLSSNLPPFTPDFTPMQVKPVEWQEEKGDDCHTFKVSCQVFCQKEPE